MAITRFPPGTIHLGGPRVDINDLSAGGTITPGMLIERFTTGGKNQVRASTLAGKQNSKYAVEASMLNHGITDNYNAGDLVEAVVAGPGTAIYALIASGQNIAFGQRLQDAGDGTLVAISSGVAIAEALEAVNAVAPGNTRIRIEVL
jgi:hypothetical protein